MEQIQYMQALQEMDIEPQEFSNTFVDHFLIHFYQYSKKFYQEPPEVFFSKYLSFHFPRDCGGLLPQQTLDCIRALEERHSQCESKLDRRTIRACRVACEEAKTVLPRLLDLKRRLRILTGEAVVQYDPLIIDINKYRHKRQPARRKDDYGERSYIETGYFQVLAVLSNQMVMLTKIGEEEKKIKVVLEREQLRHMRTGDILQLKVVRRLFYTTWDMEEVRGCYSPNGRSFLPV